MESQLINADPKALLVDVNIRKDLRLDKDFVASIKELGVLVPITAVRTSSGDLRVRFGHRRTLAAIDAGLDGVPVDVIGNEGDDDAAQIERIIGQHAENEHRAGLTAGEKVEVVAQLSAFGVKASDITKKTRIAKQDVKAALAVSKSELAKKATERYDFLTLEQAAAVAEFEGDDDAVKHLVVASERGGFDHTLERLREDRQEKVEIAKAEDELRKQGVTVVERPSWNDPVKPLYKLRHTIKTLTDQGHESCPGHAAFIEAYFDDDDDSDEPNSGKWITEATYVCTDPVAHGHLKPIGTAAEANEPQDSSVQDRIDEAAREERRRVIANNKAWRAATAVRREFVKGLMGRKKAPAGTQPFIATWLADPVAPDVHRQLTCELLGVGEPTYWKKPEPNDLLGVIAAASADRADVLTLALALGSHEAVMDEQVWRRSSAHHGRYLSQLAIWGYELSEIEQSVIDALTKTEQDNEDEEFDVPACRVCGCTDVEACEGGCQWVPDPKGLGDLCSECVEEPEGVA